LATALGSMELAGDGVLVTRLSAIEEAAAMEVLCSDKTGTITQNRLAVTGLQSYAPYGDNDLLRFGVLASDAASQDPIDLAILAAASSHNVEPTGWKRLELIPFDPATKLSEAVLSQGGERWRAIKGAPDAVARRVKIAVDYSPDVERMAAQGYRVLGVAAGPQNDLRFVGLLALEDPSRPDSKELIQSLRDLGVRVIMITGDALATARAVAARVGIGGRAAQPKDLAKEAAAEVLQSDVFAGVYPEDKFHIVQALQRAGVVTGMTGDGVNDAPALKQAEVGIAVSNATDVAKAAASLVLTNPGLMDILAAVKASRRIYQRMLTYTLNKIIKTVEIALLLSVGVMLTRSFVITPLLIVLLLFTNDFVTMSIATDTVSYSRRPDRWQIRSLVLVGLALGSLILLFSFGIFLAARYWLQLPLPELQTLVFITLVFTGQGTVYLVRQRQHFWKSRPGKWLVLSSAADIVVVSVLASRGILMEAIPPQMLFEVLIACGCYLAAVDFLKVGLLRRVPQGL
jgi:H+-transporting ATPase